MRITQNGNTIQRLRENDSINELRRSTLVFTALSHVVMTYDLLCHI